MNAIGNINKYIGINEIALLTASRFLTGDNEFIVRRLCGFKDNNGVYL